MNTSYIFRRIRFSLLTIAAFVLLQVLPLTAGEKIVDTTNGFSLAIPDRFSPNERLASAVPNIIHAFVLGDPNDDELDIILFIEKLGGTIGRERMKPEHLPPGSQARLFTTNWQGFDVEGLEVPERLNEVETITYNIQLPLKRGAIQLKLFGPAERKPDLDRLLKELLAGLSGDSNWIPSATPASSVASSENYGMLLLAGAIVIVLGGLVVLFLISRKAPNGTVFGIAAAIYMASFAIDDIRIREVVMLSGATRMLGFAGGILGIVDLVRKRKPRDQSTS